MKFRLLVFAALGFLAQVTPASGGGTRCGLLYPGHCRLICKRDESTLFMCDLYRHCCIKGPSLPEPIAPPRSRKPKTTRSKPTKKPSQGKEVTAKPPQSP